MKRILPILLALSMLLLALVACGPEENPTTTGEVSITTSAKKTTTSKILQDGISDKDDGWSFWSEK